MGNCFISPSISPMRRPTVAPPPGAQLQVLAHREAGQDLSALGDLRQAGLDDLVRRSCREIEVSEACDPGMWPEHSREGVQDSRLPGAIGTDEGDDFAFSNTKGNTTDR